MRFAIIHQLADFLRFIGLRDRLRCPSCSAVGTWKPHGGWFDGRDVRKVRRWMCKWCGYYRGQDRTGLICEPNLNTHQWEFKGDTAPTPAVVIEAHLKNVWPWRG